MRPDQDPWAPKRHGPAAPTPQAPAVWESRTTRTGRHRTRREGPRFGTVDVVLLSLLGVGLYLCYAAFNELVTAMDLVTGQIGDPNLGQATGQLEAMFTRMTILFALGGGFSMLAFHVLRWRWDTPTDGRSRGNTRLV